MRNCDVLALGTDVVHAVLAGHEFETLRVVRQAYEIHRQGLSSLPHSTFLFFPQDPANRIIALPAYLGGQVNAAGMKWIASFPGNLEHRLDRASAVLILNSMDSGRPKAILEGSVISAKRTAASAALAASVLTHGQAGVAGLIGCGLINFEIARFLLTACPEIRTFLIYDLDHKRACSFQTRFGSEFPFIDIQPVLMMDEVLKNASLISFATTAAKPHVANMNLCRPGTVVLHISLRDLSPQVILSSDNIVDDVDHVCRAQTSIHLAEQQAGHRQFIRCTLADIFLGTASARKSTHDISIFSPFGLGVLDVALGEYVFQQAVKQGLGAVLPSFLPCSWTVSEPDAQAIGRAASQQH